MQQVGCGVRRGDSSPGCRDHFLAPNQGGGTEAGVPWAGPSLPMWLLSPPGAAPKHLQPLPARWGTHSLQRLTMAVLFLDLRVLLADSDGGSSSHDRL